MNIIDIINETQHKKQFGMIIRLYRRRQQHSLRTLAERTNISHAYLRRIENGQATISKQTFDYLTQTLTINIHYDEDEERDFFKQAQDMLENILYLDTTQYKINMNKLQAKAAYHEQSLWMVDFLIVKMGYYNFMFDMSFQQTPTLYRELNAIQDLFDEQQHQAFLTYSGTHFFNTSDYEGAMQKYTEAAELNANYHLRGFDEYLIARTHMLRHHYSKAIRHLKRAHEIFKTVNNYVRISKTRLLIEIMNLMAYRRGDADHLFTDSIAFSKKYKLKGIEDFIRFTFAIYHYRLEAHDKALMILRNIDGENMQYAYYEAMIHLKKSDRASALRALRKGRELANKPEKNTLLYQYGLDVIEAYYEEASGLYETTLKRFYEEAIARKSYIESKDAYDLYATMLKKKRRYKKAYQLTRSFTDFTLQSLH
ncbi:MAG: helix-turn-helix domain-containing protein [Candidatus Izemoplasmataceae bacterium]